MHSHAHTKARGAGRGKKQKARTPCRVDSTRRWEATHNVLHFIGPALLVAQRVACMPAPHDLRPFPNKRPRLLVQRLLLSDERYIKLRGLGLSSVCLAVLQLCGDESCGYSPVACSAARL